jgi:error-prone DNA polymerase
VAPYAELHAHSGFSFLDGASDPEELVAQAVRLELSALALTDHNGLYGVVRFATAARLLGLPTVFGAELTMGTGQPRTGVPDPSGEHLLVLARGPEGYSRLSATIADAHLARGTKGELCLTLQALSEAHRGSWQILTGCRKGSVNQALLSGGPRAARRALDQLISAFGRDQVAVELWDHGHPLDSSRNDALAEIAVAAKVDLVATNNVHYATASSFALASTLSAIRAQRPLSELQGWLAPAPTAQLRSEAEQQRRFARWPGVVDRSAEIGRDCAFDLSLVAPQLPDFPVPEGFTEQTYLAHLAEVGATKRYGPRNNPTLPRAWAQIDHELSVIEGLGFAGYFLVVWDITEFCRRQNIYCQGRGSAANSAVCFSLGITNADAVRLNLFFERFLSAARDGPPDIDVDIESGRREEVLQYVYERYGRRHAAQVANVITYRQRSSIRDVAAALGYSTETTETWGVTQHVVVDSFGQPTASVQITEPSPVPGLVSELAEALQHRPRHLGIHSAGMVICDRPIVEVCPVEWARMPGRTVLQWDKDDCAAIGLVKFDLLGLGMLEALHEMVDLVAKHEGITVDLGALPQEDEVYDLLCRADTVGVFQVESRAQMATLPRLQPRCFYDLVIEVALIRPGPIQGRAVNPYLRRRTGEEEVTYPHPLLEPILRRTLGVPLFQEQLMEMAVAIAGFTPTEADELRSAMASKRSAEKMERLRVRFYAGMAEKSVTGAVADDLFDALRAFANFGFPESHSVSFAHLVYCSAWFKVHHGAAFTVALLNAQPMGFWSEQSLLADAKRHGVSVRRPHVNHSCAQATLEREGDGFVIRLGLSSVRGLGELAEVVAAGKPWASLEDLVARAGLVAAQLETLATSGALDGLCSVGAKQQHVSRRSLVWAAGPAAQATRDRLPGIVVGAAAPRLAEPTPSEQVADDLWSIGVTPQVTAVELARGDLERRGVVVAAQLLGCNQERVLVCGVVTHRQHPETAFGAVFCNLEDETGHVNVVFSKGAWVRWRSVARHAPILLVRGRLERGRGVVNVVAEQVERYGFSGQAPPSRDFR